MSFISSGLSSVLKFFGATTVPTGPTLPADVGSAAAAALALIEALVTKTADLQTVEDAANALQQVLVDLNVEPSMVMQAVELLEWLAPEIRALYTDGVITGGYPDIINTENDPNFKNR